MMKPAAVLCGALALASAGCGATTVRKVAVAPVATMGIAPSEGKTLRLRLYQEVNNREQAAPVERAKVDRALERAAMKGGGGKGCGDSTGCLGRAGKEAAADLVLSSTLAGLGELRLVRTRLIRAADGLILHDFQETVERSPEKINRYAGELTRRLFPDRRRWYQRWWVWTIAAGVTSAAVGVTWWAASRSTTQVDPSLVRLGNL